MIYILLNLYGIFSVVSSIPNIVAKEQNKIFDAQAIVAWAPCSVPPCVKPSVGDTSCVKDLIMFSSSPPTTPAEKEGVPPAQSPPRPAHVELTVINPVLSVVASSKPKPLFTRANR